MKQIHNVFALAGDPGGAAAIAPVLKKMQQLPDYRLTAFSYKQATQVFTGAGIASTHLSEKTTEECFKGLIRQNESNVVLLGTSVNGVDLEKKCTLAARQAAIPSLAVLDFWSNYRARFGLVSNEQSAVPDRIAVMDERAVKEMCELGFSMDGLVITGQPAFDKLAEWTGDKVRETKRRIRTNLKCHKREKLILFASQPLADFYGTDPKSIDHIGYTEHSVFNLLTNYLPKRDVTLIVKTHPREKEGAWCVKANTAQHFLTNPLNYSTLHFCVAADLIVGMNSVVLLEAAMIGCRILSLQPGLNGKNALAPHENITFCFGNTEKRIKSAIDTALALPRHTRGTPKPATDKVLALVDDLMSYHAHARKPQCFYRTND